MTRTVKRRGAKLWKAILVLILAVLCAITLDSTFRLSAEEYDITFETLPPAFDGFKIVQISDIHGREFGDGNSRLLKKVAEASPDIIVITGDMADDKTDMSFAYPLLSGLMEIAPTYYITGNHEYDSADLDGLLEVIYQCGVTFLDNEYVMLERGGEKIALVGVSDPNGRADMLTPEELMDTVRENEGDCFTVVLNHRNNRLQRFAALGVNLVISGHAHGGIVRLPFTDGLIGPAREILPGYTNGIYTEGSTVMFVSRGLAGHPRFLNNPHLPIITLRSSAA